MASTGQAMILPQTSLTPFPSLPLRTAVTKVSIKRDLRKDINMASDTAVGNLLPKMSQEGVQEWWLENALSGQQKYINRPEVQINILTSLTLSF